MTILVRVFLHIANRAVDLNADILLIAGDFFDKRDIDAAILSQALNGLRLFKGSGRSGRRHRGQP